MLMMKRYYITAREWIRRVLNQVSLDENNIGTPHYGASDIINIRKKNSMV
jgi:hypothetical protein